MASDGGHTYDPAARRRRIAEKGSDRLALITGGRAPTSAAPHSSNDENLSEVGGSKVQPGLRKSESPKSEPSSEARSFPTKSSSKIKIYLYKIVSPNQLHPAILASQDMRRKCAFFIGILAMLSYVGYPILSSYIIGNIILSKPLVLLLFINVSITIGPLLLDAMTLIQQELHDPYEETDMPDNLGSPFEWGMLFKTCFCAFFMDSCIYSVVVVCATSFFQTFGL